MVSELEHYGIKGMRWGVRRTPEQLGHRTTASKPYRGTPKALVEKGIFTKQELARDVLGRKVSRSQVAPRNRDSGSTSLKKGQKVQHISGINFDKVRPGQLYVTANQKDNDTYVTFLGSRLLSKGFDPKKVVLTLKTDLNAPSSKDQFKLFQSFLKENRKQVESDISDWLKEKGKTVSVKTDTKDLYDQFINAAERSSNSQKAFYSLLKSKGYNAVLDEHDITGSWMQAQKPLIIMDTMNTIGDLKVSSLNVSDLTDALDRLMKSA